MEARSGSSVRNVRKFLSLKIVWKHTEKEVATDMITHKEPDEAKVLVCDECGKKFSRQSMLDEHVRSHFNKKEFKCRICGKGFNRKSGLWCHNKYRCQVKLENN